MVYQRANDWGGAIVPGRVFISCGQKTEREKIMAKRIADLLRVEFGLTPYLAFQVQSLNDIMVITQELSKSDYYIFIDFRRDDGIPVSLFTHQELALAHILGFREEMIALSEAGVPREGFVKYVLSNPRLFENDDDLVDGIRQLAKGKAWTPHFSRNLIVQNLSHVDCNYSDHTGACYRRVWLVQIHNRRRDLAAVDTICILDKLTVDGRIVPSSDRAPIKWAGQHLGYARTILPEDFGIVNLFAAYYDNKAPSLFLHSSQDWLPREPLLRADGVYGLHYRVFSHSFPLLQFTVNVRMKAVWEPNRPTQIDATLDSALA